VRRCEYSTLSRQRIERSACFASNSLASGQRNELRRIEQMKYDSDGSCIACRRGADSILQGRSIFCMDKDMICDRISRGRTDLVFDLLALPDWRSILHEGEVKPLQWFV